MGFIFSINLFPRGGPLKIGGGKKPVFFPPQYFLGSFLGTFGEKNIPGKFKTPGEIGVPPKVFWRGLLAPINLGAPCLKIFGGEPENGFGAAPPVKKTPRGRTSLFSRGGGGAKSL